MTENKPEIVRLGREHVAQVTDVLCESFFEYPVMRFVVGSGTPDYAQRLSRFVHFIVMTRVTRGETLLGIREPDQLVGSALVSRPGPQPDSVELKQLRQELWALLGGAARLRHEAFAAACAPFQHSTPHIHLNMIGVRPSAQGQGLSRRLIEHVHNLSVADTNSEGVSLTTEIEKNVSLYQHFGYKIVGQTSVAPELQTWSFFRADADSTSQ